MAKKMAKLAVKKLTGLTVAELGEACMKAKNKDAVVCLSHADIPYAVFSGDVLDETQAADEDGDAGSLVLHLDPKTEVARILTAKAEKLDDEDDDDESDEQPGDEEEVEDDEDEV
jgi:hypothetical protein